VNKGILCGPCNEGFSPLDQLLTDQLNLINGLIGVRSDHADAPKPARFKTADGDINVDHTGRPALAHAKVARDEPLPDGRRRVEMVFSSEKQVQQWLRKQNEAGASVEVHARHEAESFFPPISAEWSFGGNDAFREIGRIGLNFLAHRWPAVARVPELKPLKEWVKGISTLGDGQPRFVWYAPADAFAIPDSAFTFGHQVVLVLSAAGSAYARIRFFSTFDLFVYFGELPTVTPAAVMYDIDPLAELAPADLEIHSIPSFTFPESVNRPLTDALTVRDVLKQRLELLLSRVYEHQFSTSTARLVDELNALRDLRLEDREIAVLGLLHPHRGNILLLLQQVAEDAHKFAKTDSERGIAHIIGVLVSRDETGSEGLSDAARAVLQDTLDLIAHGIALEIETGLTNSRLREWLRGAAGNTVVHGRLAELVERTICDEATSRSAD
jgi:hypothetical protein